ncbi:MAG: hypothetical protein V3T55_09600 [Anaerolineales bacterium]
MTFDKPSNMSPDLSWMLEGTQAEPSMIIEALMAEFYVPVYRISLSILNDPGIAAQATQETFATVIFYRDIYRAEFDVRVWVFFLAVDVCRKMRRRRNIRRALGIFFPYVSIPVDTPIDSWLTPFDDKLGQTMNTLEKKLRLPVLLNSVHGLDIHETAKVLCLNEYKLRYRLHEADCRCGNLKSRLKQTVPEHRPTLALSDGDRREITTGIENKLAQRHLGSRLFSISRLVVWAAVVAGLLVIMGLVDNWLSPPLPPTPVNTVIVTQLVRIQVMATPLPSPEVTPTPGYPQGAVFVKAQEGDTLASIAARLELELEEIEMLNGRDAMIQLEPGWLVVIDVRTSPAQFVTPTQLTP